MGSGMTSVSHVPRHVRLTVLGGVVAAAVYAVVHGVLLHQLVQADVRRDAAFLLIPGTGLDVASRTADWLPTTSTVRFLALAALAVAVVASGRRWAGVLPALVLFAGVPFDGHLPTPLDWAWTPYVWVGTTQVPDPARLWAGTALDMGLLLSPALVWALNAPVRRALVPAHKVLALSAPWVLMVYVAWWLAETSAGASPEHYVPAVLLVVGAGLLATGALPRRTVVLVLLVLPALTVEEIDTRWGGVIATITVCLTTVALAGLCAAWVLGAPHLARWWRVIFRSNVGAGEPVNA